MWVRIIRAMSSDDQKPEADDTEVSEDQPFAELVELLDEVDETSEDAEQNATTISDNNGGRIELDPGLEHKPLPTTQSVLNQEKITLVKRRQPEEKITLVKRRVKDEPNDTKTS